MKNNKILFIYVSAGALFGVFFPIFSFIFEILIRNLPFSLNSIVEIHKINKLLFVIDTAPLFLGLFALIGGIERVKAEKRNNVLGTLLSKVMKSAEITSDYSSDLLQITKKLELNEKEEETIISEIIKLIQATRENMENIVSISQNQKYITESSQKNLSFIIESSENLESAIKNSNKTFRDLETDALQGFNTLKETSSMLDIFSSNFSDLYNNISGFFSLISEINTISETIRKISEQTNMLALNAAIEASRVGEAGKGFMVVSNNVKELAANSKNASSRILEISEKISSQLHEFKKIIENNKTDLSLTAEKSNDSISSFNIISLNLKSIGSLLNNIDLQMETQIQTISKFSEDAHKLIEGTIEINSLSHLQSENESNLTTQIDNLYKYVLLTQSASDKIKKLSANLNDVSKNFNEFKNENN